MTPIAEIVRWLETRIPSKLAEDWDNTGLLVGDANQNALAVMTCLTLTRDVVREALTKHVDLVVAHHPLPFKPLKSITTASYYGGMIWALANASVSVYSPHTAWDSAAKGINHMLAEMLQLQRIEPLLQHTDIVLAQSGLGTGRIGEFAQPESIQYTAKKLKSLLPSARPRGVVCHDEHRRIAICCGSGGSLLSAAIQRGCDLFITGEATYHHCVEARDRDVSLLLLGHFASERFAMDILAKELSCDFPAVKIWSSTSESDPVCNL
ncbi:MAG: Nif3-like dinuclear metal center hexameric protein [Planctomycetales bacterium]|nr:Nif3-like dinuclear metal center hexameric protein [Planctomycetales bacterium]